MSQRGRRRSSWRSVVNTSQQAAAADEQSSRISVALVIAGVFLGLVVVAVTFYTNPKALRHAERWAQLPWIETTCVVNSVGIAYRGNCRTNVQVSMTDYLKFAECAGPTDEAPSLTRTIAAWDLTDAGRCALHGDAYYLRGAGDHETDKEDVDEEIAMNNYSRHEGEVCAGIPYTEDELKGCRPWTDMTERACKLKCTSDIAPPSCEEEACVAVSFDPSTGVCHMFSKCDGMDSADKNVVSLKKVPATDGASDRRLRLHVTDNFRSFNPPNLQCYNTYLAWALVKTNVTPQGSVDADSKARCAYEYGAELASEISSWDETARLFNYLTDAFNSRKVLRCWTLEKEDCVVAFRNQTFLEDEELYRHQCIQLGGIICAAMALIALFSATVWYLQDIGYFEQNDGHGYHIALPTNEPEQDELISDRVHEIMNVVGGQLDSPPLSGESTLRAGAAKGNHRTIEVVGPDGVLSHIPRNVAADFLNLRRH